MKQFNEEYKVYVNEEAPYLWERIEAELDARSGADVQRPEIVELEKARQERGKRMRIIRLAASVAACVAALVLIVPVYRLVSNDRQGMRAEAPALTEDMMQENIVRDTAKTGAAAEEAVDGAVPEDADDAAPLTADAGVTEIAYEEEPLQSREGEQESRAALEAAYGDETEESVDEVGTVVAAEAETNDGAQTEPTDSNVIEDLLQGAADTHVSVKVTNILSDLQQEGAAVYEVEVLQDHESGLKAAQRLTVTADEQLPSLVSGAEYDLVLEQIDLVNMTAVLKGVNK